MNRTFVFGAKNGIIEVGNTVRFDSGFESVITQEEMDNMNSDMSELGVLWQCLALIQFKAQVTITIKHSEK